MGGSFCSYGDDDRGRRPHPQQGQRATPLPARLGAEQGWAPQHRSVGGTRERRFLTSLGGSPENSSYKGYGLAVMVNILGSCLSGATLITDPMHTRKPHGNDIGHCLIAIDPGLFRDREEFAADVTRFCNDLRATKPVDPAQPVMVAGDPQWNNAAKRMRQGIPVGPGLLNQIRQIAQACAAPWLLD
jgi:LDH2 family malate/lactate/ureidoglycolate dehydrogenase